jgi:hypothetical protein
MLAVECATEILDLITGVLEIYVRSVELLTADYRVIVIRLSAVAFIAYSSRKFTVRFIITGYLNIQKKR